MFITIDSLSFIYLFFGSWILDSNNLLLLIDIITFGDDFFKLNGAHRNLVLKVTNWQPLSDVYNKRNSCMSWMYKTILRPTCGPSI